MELMLRDLMTRHGLGKVNIRQSLFLNDSRVRRVLKRLGLTTFLIPTVRILDDPEDRATALAEAHILPTAAHAGVQRMFRTLRRRFHWNGMFDEVREYVARCAVCKRQKKLRIPRTQQVMTDTPRRPLEKVYLDLYGPLEAGTYTYILTMKDDFSKYLMAVPLRRKTAESVAKAFVREWVLHLGMPRVVVTDRGTEFEGAMAAVMEDVGITHVKSTAYHHQTVGSLENTHGGLGSFLRGFVQRHRAWEEWLPYFVFAFNTTVNVATGYTPYELLYGYQCRKPSALETEEPAALTTSYAEYHEKLRYALDTMYEEVSSSVALRKERKQEIESVVAKREVCVGDRVYVRNDGRKKMDPVCTGPYEVMGVQYPNVIIRRGNHEDAVHLDRILK